MGLSEIVNCLLLANPDHQAQPFDFLVDGELVRLPLQQFLLAKGISAERVLELEYVKVSVSCWSSIPDLSGLQRCGKNCRLRWMNYLRPDLRRGRFSQQEEDLIMALHNALGNSWSQIAARLPRRSDNDIKNFWNAWLHKKLWQKETTAESCRCGEADRKPGAMFNPFPHHSAPEHQAGPAGHNADKSSNTTAVGNAVHQAGDEARSSDAVLLANADHRSTGWRASAGTSTEATRDHGDDSFLAAMVDDEASLLLGEYYLDCSHDGLFWGGHEFS